MFITFVEDTPASKKIPWANTTLIILNILVCWKTLGRTRYLEAYFLCCIAGEAAQWFFHPTGTLALIGASRAVTGLGVMYFFYYPWGRMKWIFSFFGVPLLEFPSRTAYVLVLWAGVQAALAFFPWSKLATTITALSKFGGNLFTINPTAGIAWSAHLGALLMGALLFFLMPAKKKGK